MPLGCVGRRMVLSVLSLLTVTQIASAQSVNDQPTNDQVWRCSLDGKFYTVTNGDGVHIRAINTGLMAAEVSTLTDKKGRIKTDKRGNEKLEGRWGSSTYGGLIVIQGMEPDKIRGFLLAPTSGIAASSCNSRTAAAILSFGQPGPICEVLTVRWDLQPGVSAAQAAAAETLQTVQQGSNPVAQLSSDNTDVDQQLVGSWHKQAFDGYFAYSTTIDLRSDGTYTKTLRTGAHSGSWTSSGTIVHLSGDGHWPPTNEDLSAFRKIR